MSDESKAVVAMGERGLELSSMEDMWRFAQMVAKSGMSPKGMTPEGVLVAMQIGAELGMSHMRSVSAVTVINGTPALKGEASKGLVLASGKLSDSGIESWVDGEDDEAIAHVRTHRLGDAKARETTFSAKDAKRAGLWKKSGVWSQYPGVMLGWRAWAQHSRDFWADVLMGVGVAEEVRDYTPSSSHLGEIISEQIPVHDPLMDTLVAKVEESVAENLSYDEQVEQVDKDMVEEAELVLEDDDA